MNNQTRIDDGLADEELERFRAAEEKINRQIGLVRARLLGMIAFKHDFSLDPYADEEFVALLDHSNFDGTMTDAWIAGYTSLYQEV